MSEDVNYWDSVVSSFQTLDKDKQLEIYKRLISRETYDFMVYNTCLLTFKFAAGSEHNPIEARVDVDTIIPVCQEPSMYPFRLQNAVNSKSMNDWLNHRMLPPLTKSYKSFLEENKLNGRVNLIIHGLGLGLNDAYWIKKSNLNIRWEDVNFYNHDFGRRIQNIALGNLEYVDKEIEATSCPEITTRGVVPKFWRRENGSIYLYKSGQKEGAREVIASTVLKILGLSHVSYSNVDVGGLMFSKCKLFTDEHTGYVSFRDIVLGLDRTMDSIRDFEEIFYEIGVDFGHFTRMLIADYILQNVDRHYSNFGFMVDNASNSVRGFSPLFDHGQSLFARFEMILEGKYALRTLPKSVDTLTFLRDSVDSVIAARISELCESAKSGELAELCEELYDNKYWSAWPSINSRLWIMRACDILTSKYKAGNWNIYEDPQKVNLF